MIERDISPRVRKLASTFPALTLTGPRQSGKSTLCRAMFSKHAYTNLESPDVRAFALEDPRGFLAQFPNGAVIDEVQRAPELPSYLQAIIDADPAPGKWVLTGSQNLMLLQSVSQSLAGRTAALHLLPFARSEVLRFRRHPVSLEESIFTGGYPAILDRHVAPADWLAAYVGTYVERDIRTISNIGDLVVFQRFVSLCAGRTAQLLNLSSLAADCGISQPTAKAWLSVLETSFLTFRLPAYSGNFRKRLVKMPKLHFHDTGLACWLLGIREPDQLRTHPLRGALFETWVASEVIKHRSNQGESGGVFFYRDHRGDEADLVVERAGRLLVIEAKAGQTATPDMLAAAGRIAENLRPVGKAESMVVYGGQTAQTHRGVTLVPWSALHERKW